MLVFGDRECRERVDDKLARLESMFAQIRAAPPGLNRHSSLVGALIEAGELAQGLADEAFRAAGRDVVLDAGDAAMALLMSLAEAVCGSWRSRFRSISLPDRRQLDAIGTCSITTRRAEGFAYYALYPEAHLVAAQHLTSSCGLRVVGLRSIGTTLGAIVAVAKGVAAPVTLRPSGDPFCRTVTMEEALARRILIGTRCLAIVDEGPGMSGSSVGAVMDFALARGIPMAKIKVFPGHNGPPGSAASSRHRTLWHSISRYVVSLDTLLLASERLQSWAADLVGPPCGPLLDISGGRWRAYRPDTLPSAPQSERRKFLFPTHDGPWLLKFIGLGSFGIAQIGRARVLAEAGFTPTVAGFLHGFLAERWVEQAKPLVLTPANRPPFLRHLARYLAFRSRALPAEPHPGASLKALLRMVRTNAGDIVGPQLAAWAPVLPILQRKGNAIWTDSRLHRWEWLELPEGKFLKTDAIDHASAHDLIGNQDVAWDIAGATCEFDLSPEERERLCDIVDAESGRAMERLLVQFFNVAYPAFQLGSFTMAATANPSEKEALLAQAERYRVILHRRAREHSG